MRRICIFYSSEFSRTLADMLRGFKAIWMSQHPFNPPINMGRKHDNKKVSGNYNTHRIINRQRRLHAPNRS